MTKYKVQPHPIKATDEEILMYLYKLDDLGEDLGLGGGKKKRKTKRKTRKRKQKKRKTRRGRK